MTAPKRRFSLIALSASVIAEPCSLSVTAACLNIPLTSLNVTPDTSTSGEDFVISLITALYFEYTVSEAFPKLPITSGSSTILLKEYFSHSEDA